MTVPVLLIDGVDVTEEIHGKLLTLRLNALDATLMDPTSIPMLGDDVWCENPTWAGTVTSVTVDDKDLHDGHLWVKVTATNEDEAAASAAPFGLVDTAGDYRRLQLTRTLHDGAEEVRGTLETFLPGLLPGMTFQLTADSHNLAAADFTITDVGVNWLMPETPLFRIAFGDAIVTMSVWVNSTASGIFPITSTRITDGAVTTPKLAANAVDATKLSAVLALISLIKTADSGSRVELDAAGFRAYSSADDLLVNIPTDGSNVYVNAVLEALTLSVTGNAVFQGAANEIALAAILQLDSHQNDPTQAPALVAGYAKPLTLAEPTGFDSDDWESVGGYYDAAGGADGATACFVAVVYGEVSGTGTFKVVEWKLSDGSIDRTTTLSISTSYTTPAYITRIGTSWYLTNQYSTSRFLWKVTRATGTATAAINITADFYGGISGAITTDGTDLYVIGDNAAAGDGKRISKYNTSLVYQSNVALTNAIGDLASDDLLYADIGSGGRFWVTNDIVPRRAYEYATTGAAPVANTDFPIAVAPGLVWDGTNFKGSPGVDGDRRRLYTYTNWTWTTASAIYWVAYSWYDANATGSTHESVIGPRQSITMDRRRQLTVTTQAIPGGVGNDYANNVRIYMKPNATDPGSTALKLQSTGTATTVALTDYASAGAADPASNNFPAGTPAEIKSQTAGWSLKGDGSFKFPELDYVQITGNVTVSGTTQATATTVATSSAVVYDGATVVLVEASFPRNQVPGSGNSLTFHLFDGSTAVAQMGVMVNMNVAGDFYGPVRLALRYTPAAGTRTLYIKSSRGSANCTVHVGAGTGGALVPGFIRITRA